LEIPLKTDSAGCWWLMFIIIELGRIKAQGQPGQIVCETMSPKYNGVIWTGVVAQVIQCLYLLQTWSPEFKPQFHQKTTKKEDTVNVILIKYSA
jgi:hypothetical protein